MLAETKPLTTKGSDIKPEIKPRHFSVVISAMIMEFSTWRPLCAYQHRNGGQIAPVRDVDSEHSKGMVFTCIRCMNRKEKVECELLRGRVKGD